MSKTDNDSPASFMVGLSGIKTEGFDIDVDFVAMSPSPLMPTFILNNHGRQEEIFNGGNHARQTPRNII